MLLRQLSTLADLVDGGYFAGIHLEGPFLSAAQPGAHDRSLLRSPDPETVDRLIEAGRGHLTTVTLAPELPGGRAAIPRFLDAGVRVAVGHTDADRGAMATALDAGATVATHLFNAMRSIHHRKPGPVPLLLTDPRVAVELIADRIHVHPDVLRMAASAAGPDRVLLVTDAMAAAGKPDGEFALGGRKVHVRHGMARLVGEDGSPGAIAGSTLTMAEAFQTMTEITGSIEVAAAMASTNAARHLGLARSRPHRGGLPRRSLRRRRGRGAAAGDAGRPLAAVPCIVTVLEAVDVRRRLSDPDLAARAADLGFRDHDIADLLNAVAAALRSDDDLATRGAPGRRCAEHHRLPGS